jgi:hypothetical protein
MPAAAPNPVATAHRLRDISRQPGALAGMAAVGGEAFDGGEAPLIRLADGHLTGTNRFAPLVNGAGSADADSAAVFRSGQAELIAQHPEKRRVGVGIDRDPLAVDRDRKGRHVDLRRGFRLNLTRVLPFG